MKKALFMMLCSALFCVSCSSDEEKRKSSIDSFTEETAETIAGHIQDPLNKARAVQKVVDKHSGEIGKESEGKD